MQALIMDSFSQHAPSTHYVSRVAQRLNLVGADASQALTTEDMSGHLHRKCRLID